LIAGIGIDLVDIARIRRLVSGASPRFVERVYTTAEAAYCRRHTDPAPHFAARFAAKEALLKALGTGWAEGIQWRHVEVERAAGPPRLVLHDAALERARARAVVRLHLSLTHSELTAAAVVILEV